MAKEQNGEKSAADSGFSGASPAKLWKTALLLAGSAAFGGLAVALWNRKTLSEMHRRPSEPVRPLPGEEDIY
jgi:hypothetical protein